MEATYINPFTDFGFKKLFGEEANLDLLRDFLTELLRNEVTDIETITFSKNEHFPAIKSGRKTVYDLYCTNSQGEKFIVEIQKAEQKFFKDRTLYYATFPIQEQAQKGKDWDFELTKVFTVGILNFVFDEDIHDQQYRYDVKLTDQQSSKVFYDKLLFVFLEMPKFNKTIEQCETRFERWLYVIKNLDKLDRMPAKLHDQIFDKFFNEAAVANLSQNEYAFYTESLKDLWDLQNVTNTAEEKGKEIGIQIGRKEGEEIGRKEGEEIGINKGVNIVAKNLKDMGLPFDVIAKSTGLTIEEIEKIE